MAVKTDSERLDALERGVQLLLKAIENLRHRFESRHITGATYKRPVGIRIS